MTLQYRRRSKYQDELWRGRVYLCERLMSEAVNQWYLSGGEFPTQPVVAGVLYLFSPRCEPLELSPYHLVERLGKIMRRLLRDIAAGKETTGDTTTLEDYSVLATLREKEES